MVKILQAIDGFIFDVVLWAVFIPKTLVKIIIAPTWADSYVRVELDKDAAQRYEAYMSPILFFIITGILPILTVGRFTCLCSGGAWVKLNQLSMESNILALAVVYISPPLIYSLIILRWKRRPIDRNTLRPIFHTQCLLWGAFYFLLMPLFWVYMSNMADSTQASPSKLGVMAAVSALMLVVFIWFLRAEYKLILRELHKKPRSLGVSLLCYIISALFINVTLYLIDKMVS